MTFNFLVQEIDRCLTIVVKSFSNHSGEVLVKELKKSNFYNHNF